MHHLEICGLRGFAAIYGRLDTVVNATKKCQAISSSHRMHRQTRYDHGSWLKNDGSLRTGIIQEWNLERQQFEKLALEQLDAIFRMAMQLTRHPDEASDLVQA